VLVGDASRREKIPIPNSSSLLPQLTSRALRDPRTAPTAARSRQPNCARRGGGRLGSVKPTDAEHEGRDWPYDAQGVDRSLVRWMLSLTPTERLEAVEDVITMLETTRRDGEDP
jgi:hypothetical protein